MRDCVRNLLVLRLPQADITIQFSKDLSISVNGFAYYPKWGGKVTFNDNVNWTVDSAGGDSLKFFLTLVIMHVSNSSVRFVL